jgi:hypothetical protein
MTKDFIIIFFGLIAHFGLPNGDATVERAVLTRFDHHAPILFLRDADIQSPMPTPFPLTAIKSGCSAPSGVTCYDLTGVHLQILGLPSGPLLSADPHLPRLTQITDGTSPEPQVKNADITFAHAFAYVDYTGGCLKAPALNKPNIDWGPPQPPFPQNCHPSGPGPSCMPLYTVHDSTPTGMVILYVAEGPAVNPSTLPAQRQITLTGNSTIAIGNVSGHFPGPDYKDHLWLNNGNCMLELQRNGDCKEKPDTRSCDGKFNLADLRFTERESVTEFINRYSVEVECGQTQNPPPP